MSTLDQLVGAARGAVERRRAEMPLSELEGQLSGRGPDRPFNEALAGLGAEHALVVSAEDGVDELSVTSRTRVIEVRAGTTEEWFTDPEDHGLARAHLDAVAGGDPEANAAVTERVLAGEAGPAADLVALNAGAAIFVGGGAEDLGGGIERAREAIGSGSARDVLARLVALTGEIAAD